jgi:hypothetical protein
MPEQTSQISPTVESRFWSKVNKDGPIPFLNPELGPCWIWMAGVSSNGYGGFANTMTGKSVRAHKFAWEMRHGKVPVGLFVCHLCDNPLCTNVERHLYLGTPRQNAIERVNRKLLGGKWRQFILGQYIGRPRMVRRKSVIGMVFNLLTVIADAPDRRDKDGHLRQYAVCRCKCGTVIEKRVASLFRGDTLSCGCLKESEFTDPVTAYWTCVNTTPDANGCWLWRRTITAGGYGVVALSGGRQIFAHRISYEIHHGPITKGMDICHRCDVRQCSNPAHLFMGTRQQNVDDAKSKGRLSAQTATLKRLWATKWCVTKRGENNTSCKLTEDKVLEMRRLYKKGVFGFKKLSEMFGISHGVAQRVIARKTWTHI